MEMILTMIEYGGAKEDDDDYQSPLDLLFEALEEEQPEHIAVRQYKIFKQAAGKTAKSILVSAAVRLSVFTLPEIQSITNTDTMELEKLGERKQAMQAILKNFENYICHCSKRTVIDSEGNRTERVDPEIKERIEEKLMLGIIYKFDLAKLPEGETLED